MNCWRICNFSSTTFDSISIYIRDLLGHSGINTTEMYARSDAEMKRKALEKTTSNAVSTNLPSWHNDKGLISWLQGLCKPK